MPELPPSDSSFSELLKGAAPSKADQQIEELQKELEKERDARREERFIFIVVLTLLLDIILFTFLPSVSGPLAIVTLELLILIPLANRMGVQEIAQMLDRALGRLSGKQ